MSRSGFSHIGKVVALEGDRALRIEIERSEACDGCHAKGHCFTAGEAESKRRVMDVSCCDTAEYSVGDSVEVSITYRVGVIAVVAAYITPLIVFVAAIIVGAMVGIEQGVVALVAFLLMAIYYAVLYLCRERFERVVEFGVRKINNF